MNERYNEIIKKWEKAEPIKYKPTCWLEEHFPRLFEKLWEWEMWGVIEWMQKMRR